MVGDLDAHLTHPVGWLANNFLLFSRVEGRGGGSDGYGCPWI